MANHVLYLWLLVLMRTEIESTYTTTPSNTAVLYGESATLYCSTDLRPVSWQFLGLGTTSPVLISNNNVTRTPKETHPTIYSINNTNLNQFDLTINDTQWYDAGAYACQDGSGGISPNAELVVLDVKLSTNLSVYQLVQGESVLVTCNVTYSGGLPSPMISLYNQFGTILETSTNIISTVVTADSESSLYFTCSVNFSSSTNKIFAASTSVISILYPVQNVSIQVNGKTVPSNANTTLYLDQSVNCTAAGFPVPQYMWQRLKGDHFVFVDNGPILNYMNALADGVQTYRCTAYNTVLDVLYNSTSSNFTFNVVNETAQVADMTSPSANLINQYAVPLGVGLGVGIPVLLIVIIILTRLVCCRKQVAASNSKDGVCCSWNNKTPTKGDSENGDLWTNNNHSSPELVFNSKHKALYTSDSVLKDNMLYDTNDFEPNESSTDPVTETICDGPIYDEIIRRSQIGAASESAEQTNPHNRTEHRLSIYDMTVIDNKLYDSNASVNVKPVVINTELDPPEYATLEDLHIEPTNI